MANRGKGEISEVCQEEVFDGKAETHFLVKVDYFLLIVLLTPSVGHFHTRESSSSLRTPAGGPPIQFTSERAPSGRRPSKEGPSPQDHAHLTTNHRRGPKSPTLLSNLLHMEGAPQNSGHMRLTCCSARGKQPDREAEGEVGVGLACWNLSPWNWGVAPSQLWAPQSRCSLNPRFREVPLRRAD